MAPRADDTIERTRREAGTGLLATSAAVLVFLLFMLFAVQVTITLYATSTINAAGYDAARHVASFTVDHQSPSALNAATAEAEAQFRQMLGEFGRRADLQWEISDEQVRLHVKATAPSLVPSTLARTTRLTNLDRIFTVRVEKPSR